MARILNNGQTLHVPSGANVTIINGAVQVDGIPWNGGKITGPVVTFIMEGDMLNLHIDRGNVEVRGSIHGALEAGGPVTVAGSVGGAVDAVGDVACGSVGGAVEAAGNVTCGDVGGAVHAGGSVKHG